MPGPRQMEEAQQGGTGHPGARQAGKGPGSFWDWVSLRPGPWPLSWAGEAEFRAAWPVQHLGRERVAEGSLGLTCWLWQLLGRPSGLLWAVGLALLTHPCPGPTLPSTWVSSASASPVCTPISDLASPASCCPPCLCHSVCPFLSVVLEGSGPGSRGWRAALLGSGPSGAWPSSVSF